MLAEPALTPEQAQKEIENLETDLNESKKTQARQILEWIKEARNTEEYQKLFER
ncbi:4585_t:CDS:2 [Entrophospora sp. SA101]|nr:10405_t:CDS:2 [Entrophospora sp. SA101]CAJ0747172.1 4585_t:CDS:2 [Entrophospora sp. SA101]CAJ0825389.1 7658_t:CDS:2 [Entrophospora sp. SA101]CAJ0872654.1 5020_t:CDS:2 [Entrophospora sp. SA101]